MDKVIAYRSRGQWRWRYVAANGHVMADSGEGYRRPRVMRHAAAHVLSCDELDTASWQLPWELASEADAPALAGLSFDLAYVAWVVS